MTKKITQQSMEIAIPTTNQPIARAKPRLCLMMMTVTMKSTLKSKNNLKGRKGKR